MVFTFLGRLAYREDERSKFHSVLYAWRHAAERERCYYERVSIWTEVSFLVPISLALLALVHSKH